MGKYTTLIDEVTRHNRIYDDIPFQRTSPVAGRYFLYPPPNGGKRILPVVYTQLTERWLRADGVPQEIDRMNSGHLLNTIKLLRESHNNLTGSAVKLVGKIWHHYGNLPGVQDMCVALAAAIERAEVDDVYPVFTALASEMSKRGDGSDPMPLNPIEQKKMDEAWAIDGAEIPFSAGR